VTDPVLLDTCACLWLAQGEPLMASGQAAIEQAKDSGAGVHVSAITAWEVATLVRKGRYRLRVEVGIWFERLIGLPGMRLAALDPRILVASAFLPGEPPRDPADRIIAATARILGLTVITRDAQLLAYGKAGHLTVTAC
jgi:PIN domain nuclease of toxin-antitoxin system